MKRLYLSLLFTFCLCAFLSVNTFAQNIEVKGAGTEEINGIYKPAGKKNGKTQYKKDEYVLFYRGCKAKWMIKSPDGNMYRNKRDADKPPQKGWEKGCGNGSLDPAPTLILITDEKNKNKNN